MYESFYGFREKPFSLLPDPGFLYLSRKHRMALVLLEYGLMNQAGFSVITGEIGTGKTTLIRQLLNQIDRDMRVGLITNTHRSFGELMQWVLSAFDIEYRGKDRVQMYRDFVDFIVQEYANKRRTVLIVDEAQNMSAETLEELRMLSNVNADKDQVLQVILVGQAQLRDLLRRPDLEQFAQRIAVDYHLEPLDADETAEYIRHRLKVAGGDPELFEPEACAVVYRYSGGVPRLTNLLCDTALVYGFAEEAPRITAALVEEVAKEKQKSGIFPARQAEPPARAPRKPEPAPKPAAAASPPKSRETGAPSQTAQPDRPREQRASTNTDRGSGGQPDAAPKPPSAPTTSRPVSPPRAAVPETKPEPVPETAAAAADSRPNPPARPPQPPGSARAASAVQREPAASQRPQKPAETAPSPKRAATPTATGAPAAAPDKANGGEKRAPASPAPKPTGGPTRPPARNDTLRVALATNTEPHREWLAALLEAHHARLAATVPLAESAIDGIGPGQADVLLIDFDGTQSQRLDDFIRILKHCHVPVLFQDLSAAGDARGQDDGAERARLLRKLSGLTGWQPPQRDRAGAGAD